MLWRSWRKGKWIFKIKLDKASFKRFILNISFQNSLMQILGCTEKIKTLYVQRFFVTNLIFLIIGMEGKLNGWGDGKGAKPIVFVFFSYIRAPNLITALSKSTALKSDFNKRLVTANWILCIIMQSVK